MEDNLIIAIFFFVSRGLSFGGKGSTEYLVKGSHKDIPQELVNELKSICQVFYQLAFHYTSGLWLLRFMVLHSAGY